MVDTTTPTKVSALLRYIICTGGKAALNSRDSSIVDGIMILASNVLFCLWGFRE